MYFIYFYLFYFFIHLFHPYNFTASCILYSKAPKFGNLMSNLTVTVGRDAVLICIVDNISTFKIAWLRVDTQTILTIENLVVTKNDRIAVSNSDGQVWRLHIKSVKTTDRGWYMCQINTEPMKSQTAYLEIVAPPDILDYPTSSDMIAVEGSNVTLMCATTGLPPPLVTWRREDGQRILIHDSLKKDSKLKSSTLTLVNVDSHHSGIYMCIASNGVPPTVSKRISIIVQYPPRLHVTNQLIGAYVGNSVTLECESDAYPEPIVYWILRNGQLITQGQEMVQENFMFKVRSKLFIYQLKDEDFGIYICVSKNALGMAESIIRLYSLGSNNDWSWNPSLRENGKNETLLNFSEKNNWNICIMFSLIIVILFS